MNSDLLQKMREQAAAVAANVEFVDNGGQFEDFDPVQWAKDNVPDIGDMAIGDGSTSEPLIPPTIESPGGDGGTNEPPSTEDPSLSQGDNITPPAGQVGAADDLNADTITLPDGTTIPVATVKMYLDLDAAIQRDPTIALKLQQAFNPVGIVPEIPQAPVGQAPTGTPQIEQPTFELPEGIDTDDPAIAYMLSQIELVKQQNQQIALQNAAEAQRQVDAQVTSGLNRWVAEKASVHRLTQPEMDLVRSEAVRLNILNSLVATGMDAASATVEALERAYWGIPQFRDKEIEKAAGNRAQIEVQNQIRQQKLTALGGNSGQAPRVVEPLTKAARTPEAMAAEIEQWMGAQ